MSRLQIYHDFKQVYDNDDVKNPHLLHQQRFLRSYVIHNYDSINKMLLFHGIGTGKTCTSITIAETIMERDPNIKTLVILPARLQTNFKDELISATCGLRERYITSSDYDSLFNQSTNEDVKRQIIRDLDQKINEKYDIRTYDNVFQTLKKSTDIISDIQTLTRNKVIIIDEVHNLVTSKIRPVILQKVIHAKRILPNTPSVNGVIMRLLTKYAHPTCKMFFLTATPIYDNYGQFIELILNLCPDIDDDSIQRNMESINSLVPNLKGKISFYKLDDPSFFPTVETDNLLIPFTFTQETAIISKPHDDDYKYDEDIEYGDSKIKDNFCIRERQLSISTLSKDELSHTTLPLNEYAPKISKLLELLELDGKHLIYSSFIENGLDIIAKILEINGWSNYLDPYSSKKNYKTFVIWDSDLNNKQKTIIKELLNNPDNLDGKNIRVILGSPSIKEGISFKHIQHLHQIDPVWNSSAKEQIEGRCIRYKSHEDIPLSHPKLNRKVIIHNYISNVRQGGILTSSCDVKLYKLILKKMKIVKILENILKKVSIDYYLSKTTPPSRSSSLKLPTDVAQLEELTRDDNDILGKPEISKNTCPEERRPVDGKCTLEGYSIIRKNNQGFDCCYKKEQGSIRQSSIRQKPKEIEPSTIVTRSSARKQALMKPTKEPSLVEELEKLQDGGFNMNIYKQKKQMKKYI
jgi:hypothetical protein